MKILMMTDIEGVSGVVDFESQTTPTGRYYEKAKTLFTQEVNSAVEGALSAGASEILVIDGHGEGALNFEELHPDAKAFIGRPAPSNWFFDQNFSAAFFVGCHSMVGTVHGNLNHTYNKDGILNMYLNGKRIGEIGMEIILAGCFDVPAIFISGDRAACEEAQSYVPNIETAIVKEGINRTAAVCLSKESARKLIREKSEIALKKINIIKPYKIKGPFELITEYNSTAFADKLAQRLHAEKIDPRSVSIKADSFLELLSK